MSSATIAGISAKADWEDQFCKVMAWAVLTLLLVVSAGTLVDILLRAFTPYTVRGLFELNGLFMAIIVAGLSGLVFVRHLNIRMDVMKAVAGSNQHAVRLVCEVAEVLVFGWLATALLFRALDAQEYGEKTMVVGWHTAGWWAAAGLLMSLAVLTVLIQTLKHWYALFKDRGYAEPGFWRGALVTLGTIAVCVALTALFINDDNSPGMQAGMAFLVLYLLIAAQIPIGVSLLIVGVASLALTMGGEQALVVSQNEVGRALTSMDMAAIPLFLLMGNFATWAGLSGDIFNSGTALLGSRRGGLAMASVLGCGGFGAICGSSIATTATFGKVAFVEMERRNYAHSLAAGCIAAGGTLGALIPPSVVLIVYCVVVEESIQIAFQAALIPGVLALTMYVLAIFVSVRLKPSLAPDVEEFNWPVARAALVKAWRPVLLFALVLGGLYGGMFTTQEAASVGALLAFVFAVSTKGFTLEKFKASLIDTAINAGAIYVIFIGANIFASFMSFTDIAQLVLSIIDLETMPKWLILFGLVVFYLLLGTVFDTLAAVLVTTPLVVPLIIGMDYDLIWWGVVTLSLVEIGMITPPLGMNVFVMRSVVGDRLPLSTIFRGVTPFLVADLIRVILLTSFPIITMWLPSVLSGN
ncbi:TRAP transporter large permease [Paenalcaligenes suwonensis]|uniref:TRAP transporter large permease n=1 Tax=Paenalcaligenes suwonensis TaxID=1202713 RepID=UPI00140BCC88|nr:TRAP transporter large permease [Paenalcaligenes suwonensis]NHC62824.1 TRAP transporter large permease [Paenalcaligenes suwonensis]